ncbi:hypothetical protein GBF35_45770 [Nonomuraea phyllanthi]|uniref:RNA polymerase sigma factor n=1 Tax=Nonomuraea phyllanthi TaxID=2219224 RepID=UPI00129395DE|nr:hypothetical protein [Nonomuraea phyllanthi]QFY12903.1 hypothetical protein GBF35_45770 [Nonomuraea phyllanthi]
MSTARGEARHLINDDNATLDAAMTAAARAAEHLKDGAEWVDQLQRSGLESGVAKTLSSHVFAYAWPTLLKKIYTSEIIDDCEARFQRTLVSFTPSEREIFRSSKDQRATLAVGTMLAASGPFLEALYAGQWKPARASLPSFFVGACINHFPDTLKKWRHDRHQLLVGLAPDATLQPRTPMDSPFERVELGNTIRIILDRSDIDTRTMCVMIALGYTRAEVAAHLQMSEGAVNQRLYRLRQHAWGLAEQGRIIPPAGAERPTERPALRGARGRQTRGASSTGPGA